MTTNRSKHSLSFRERLGKLRSQRRITATIRGRVNRYASVPGDLSRYLVTRLQSPTWDVRHIERARSKISELPESMFNRMVASYTLMKRDEETANRVFMPSLHWQQYVDRSFKPMTEAIQQKNRDALSLFLSNMLTRDLGIEFESVRNLKGMAAVRYVNHIRDLHAIWQANSNDSNIDRLETSSVGNPNGYRLDGTFITSGAFGNDIFSSRLAALISKVSTPIICEIGGGYGKLAHKLVAKVENATYIDFDIPEMVVIIYYFLSTVFPDKTFLLYGEETPANWITAEYDFVLMPGYAIESLPDNACDLIINKNSFGEMNRSTVEEYLVQISRCTKQYFYSMNHEQYPDTASDDPGLPSSMYSKYLKSFIRILHNRETVHFTILGSMSDIYEHVYEKQNSPE